MHTLLRSCGFLLTVSLLAGCTTTTPGLGAQAGTTALPSGLRLLDSDEGRCHGTAQVDGQAVAGRGRGLETELFVEPGENATFELQRGFDEVEWACNDGNSPDVNTMRCPRGTSHVRLTRASTGGELLFECYG